MARHSAGREIEMPCEIDVQLHADQIRNIGYTVIERAAAADLVDGLKQALLRTEHEHGLGYAKTSFEGFKTVRINNLLTYDDLFWQVPLHANVLPIVERVLDKECLLSSFCSLVLGPGQEAQPIHEDTQLIPLPRPHIPITLNAIWALSDFREDNGATRILPGSHKYDCSPEYGKEYDAVTATMPAGSVMLFDSALWHGGGANISGSRRFALSCAYCWGWMRQQENLQTRHSPGNRAAVSAPAAGAVRLQRLQGTVRAHRQPRSDRAVGARTRQAHGLGSDRRPQGADGYGREVNRHARACPGHPRLSCCSSKARRGWPGRARP
jgi:ectoine hydroxylase-related dioxygenase (phytanoyl-CoA dioxygenase family)